MIQRSSLNINARKFIGNELVTETACRTYILIIVHFPGRAATEEIKISVCINKYDSNIELTEKIERWCADHRLPFVGRIPFDPDAVRAVNAGKTIVDVDCISGNAVRDIYQKTVKQLFDEGAG